MRSLAKKIASRLPTSIRNSVQRSWYTYRIRSGDFQHRGEPEFQMLNQWVQPGDIVLDIGANIGIFTAELSRLVGNAGRVIAFEPVPETFRFLVHNSRLFPFSNITFFNVAVSSESRFLNISVPVTSTGIPASARASIQEHDDNGIRILGVPIGALAFPQPVRFVKIDVEGHEIHVIRGMRKLLESDRPRCLIEGEDPAVRAHFDELGYRHEKIKDSPNTIFHPE